MSDASSLVCRPGWRACSKIKPLVQLLHGRPLSIHVHGQTPEKLCFSSGKMVFFGDLFQRLV